MAGIGFELRKILKKKTLLSIVEAYGLAGLISSGPWVLSILALLMIGIVSLGEFQSYVLRQFLILVTYLMAGSLIISGLFQLLLTRFISDLIYLKQENRIVPNLLGAMLVMTLLSAVLAGAVLAMASEINPLTKVIIFSAFIILCNQWLILILLSGTKEYYRVFMTMLMCYGLMIGLCMTVPAYGLTGLISIFTLCQALLTFIFLYHIVRNYPAKQLISFDFLQPGKVFYSLLFCGLFYNLGVWLDKFVFWSREETSHKVFSIFNASYIYDLPIFIAYLAIVPGMAVFIMRMETDFSQACLKFYDAVRDGGTLSDIYRLKDKMVLACRHSIYEIFKVQGMTLVLLMLWAEDILIALNINLAYLHLLYVDLIGVSFQVLVMAILNIMYYLDKRYAALALTVFMALSNFILAHISIELGPLFYGYGFTLTMLLTTIIGFIVLDKQFSDLEYQTFMLQRS